MSKMLRRLKQTLDMLGRDIIVGERYERNLRSIRDMSLILMLAGTVMFIMNILSRAYMVSLTSVAIMLAGAIIYGCVRKRNRVSAMRLTVAAVILIFTYDIFIVDNGFAFLWTMLVPLAISYLFSVKMGILVSVYFWLLFVLAFYTPLRHLVENHYPPIIMVRFPVLFFFHIVFTGFVMIQYHKSVLDQMDYNRQLQSAKEEAEHARQVAEQAREAAESANVAKSDFLANVSHEIRTPINAVLGMNEMIIRESAEALENPDTELRDAAFTNISSYAGSIQSAGNSLLSIINDILDLSRIEARRLEIVEGDYSLSSLLNDVRNMFLFRVRDKGIDFQLDADEEIPDGLYGDEVRVRQVITNLLSNAVKYTNEGSIRLEVHGQADEIRVGAPITLAVSVRDTGIGIREEDMDRLFTKFQRIDLQRNSTVEGAGLGLAISKQLLDMMGGTIRVESTYGEGSVFTFALPQRIASCEPIGDFRARFEKNAPGGKNRGERFRAPEARILIVDDTRMNLTVVTSMLKKTGLQMDTAISGAEAVELTRTRPYDLILMDQRMPEMDGTEALRHIRAQRDGMNCETPVISLTADAVVGARERYISEGFTDYLTKPIDSAKLEVMLMKYLPDGKVTPVGKDSQIEEKPTETAERDALLRAVGIDAEAGLFYCQGDASLYQTILRDYAHGAAVKAMSLRRHFEEGDWVEYAVQAHAIKSTSKMIGASSLSDLAAALEQSANNGDEVEIREKHQRLLDQYEETARGIQELLDADNGADQDDDAVLEFLPI